MTTDAVFMGPPCRTWGMVWDRAYHWHVKIAVAGLGRRPVQCHSYSRNATGRGLRHRRAPGGGRQRPPVAHRGSGDRGVPAAWNSTWTPTLRILKEAYSGPHFVVVAAHRLRPDANFFDTSSVEAVINRRDGPSNRPPRSSSSPRSRGFTDRMCQQHDTDRILFAPEFLREGKALHDNLHPPGSWWARVGSRQGVRRPSCWRVRWNPRRLFSSPTPSRRKRSNCSPTPTSPCAWPSSTSSTPSPRATGWTAATSSRA